MANPMAALRGALGFLSRLPVGHDEDTWAAFRSTPTGFPLAGYVLGALLVVPLLVPAPAPTVALLYVAAVYLLTGVTHADGVTDLGDAAAVHGDRERRREVLADSDVGTGGALALGVVVVGLALAALALARLGPRAAVLVLSAEVGAKLGMATLVCRGSAAHEGLGSTLTSASGPRSLWLPVALALPAALSGWPLAVASGGSAGWSAAVPTAAAVLAALAVAVVVRRWARRYLGGVTGDVLGATNELGRIAALHVGVVAWTQF